MTNYRTFRKRENREPTLAESRKRRELEETSVPDPYVPIGAAPDEFWQALRQATHWIVCSPANLRSTIGAEWWDELRWQNGWPEENTSTLADLFDGVILRGSLPFSRETSPAVIRLAVIEVLLDVSGTSPRERDRYHDLVNEAADRFRVGIRLEGRRFVDVTSEHVHEEVIRPTLRLLSDPELEQVDALYRKAFERQLARDAAGAITAATSAVEEMLRARGCSGSSLQPLAQDARKRGWITPGVEQQIIKLDAFRGESDAHTAGTDEQELAGLVVRLAASLILYLGSAEGAAQ